MNPSLVAIVTGSSRGIGAAIAQRLAKDGHAVIVNYAGNAEEAAKVVANIVAAGGQATAIRADVADAAAVRRLFDETERLYGRVDVLVNNAGIMPPSLPAATGQHGRQDLRQPVLRERQGKLQHPA